MPVKLTVRHNLAAIADGLDDDAKTQVPYAIALTLTRTAQEVRDSARAHLGDYFTVRNQYVGRSIQMDRAEKKDADPTARVGSLYAPMADHAEGGSKSGAKGGFVGVPVWARPTKDAKTKPSQFPGKLAKRADFFIAPFSREPFRVGGEGDTDGVALFQRVGKKKGRRHLKLWWSLEEEVAIKPDWPFERDGIAIINASVVDNFWAAMEQARATSKRSYKLGR